jgi:hypothetical protein
LTIWYRHHDPATSFLTIHFAHRLASFNHRIDRSIDNQSDSQTVSQTSLFVEKDDQKEVRLYIWMNAVQQWMVGASTSVISCVRVCMRVA